MTFQSDTFVGQNKLKLFYRVYKPDGKITAILLPVHGLCEHSGRYLNVVNYFVPRGYAFYILDHRGHGQSEGTPGYVEKFSYFVDDLNTFMGIVRRENPASKIFLVGHSIGGLIASIYAIDHQKEFDGLIVSAATIQPGSSMNKKKLLLARMLAFIAPHLGMEKINADGISRSEKEVAAYENDPLVYRGKITIRLGLELINAMRYFDKQMYTIRLPVLIMSGTSDILSDPKSSKTLFDNISSKDKMLKYYTDFYHEIFNEPQCEEVFVDMEHWLATHL